MPDDNIQYLQSFQVYHTKSIILLNDYAITEYYTLQRCKNIQLQAP